jgi:UDP-N-acetylmuramoylalanine--D-glutamate ligase
MKAKYIKGLINKNLAFIGLGAENLSFIKFLLKNKVVCRITVCDPKTAAELGDRFLEIKQLARKNKMPEIAMMTGKNYDAHLTDFDIVFRSPGYPLFSANLLKAAKMGVVIDSPMRAFFEICPTTSVIGVTGSKGKGTTSSLIYTILKAAKKDVYLGGNIGIAPFDFFDKLKPSSFVVLELSSFQLEDLERSPRIAVITNIYKEHLAPADPANPNYHKSSKAYWEAKANIFKYQKKADLLVVNEKLKAKNEKLKTRSKIVFYGKSELPSSLTGEHNKENIAAAEEVAKALKIKKEIIAKAVKGFKGLPHRLEFVVERKGVGYFDDSFATMPEASIIALRSFDVPVVLLAGGADKGLDFKPFAKEIKKRVKALILFSGKGSDKLKKVLSGIGYDVWAEVCTMEEAVRLASGVSESGEVVLLSTGCASFGCFKNYKERGDKFKQEAKAIK